MRKFIPPFIIILVAVTPLRASDFDHHFNAMVDDAIRRTVPLITVEQLSARIKSKRPPVILDTREAHEFSTSHIPGARMVGYRNFSMKQMGGIGTDETIIVYCSIGYRSEKIGERLIRAGYKNVYNLYGGIFYWFNKKNPVVDASGKPTTRIHGFNRQWGEWVIWGEKVY
jgi:rhodanese-related sulfurtransferase